MVSRTLRAVLMLGACGAACAAPALAQKAPSDKGDKADSGEIIVTAQNRSEKLQNVPIAINVISGDQLKKVGFSDLNDVGKIAPVVQLNQDQGTVKVTVRGVGTTSNDEAQDTSVVVNIDGEYINRPNVLGISLFDMERVEVLRGPQGTLYGRNSTGGAINFITRKPGNKLEVDGTASYGNYNAVRVDAGADIPLSSIAAVRFSGFYDKHDGYVSSPAQTGFFIFPSFPAFKSDDNKAYGGRVALRLDPSSQLAINVSADYANRSFTPQAYAAVNLNGAGNGPTGPGCNSAGYTLVAPAYQTAPGYGQTLCVPSNTNFLSTIDRGNFTAPLYGQSWVGEQSFAVRGRAAYTFSDAAILTYTGAYRRYVGDPNSHLALPDVYQSFTFLDKADTQSHELRLNGKINGVIYQVGGFYFNEKQNRENGFYVGTIEATPGGPGSYQTYFGRYVHSDSKSVFGQVEVPLGDKLTAVGGLRYTDNTRSALYLNGTPFGAGPPDAFLVAAGTATTNYLFGSGPARKNILALPYLQKYNLASSESKVTWLADLNYKPSTSTLIFAKVTTGFKGGGFDSVGVYKPETNTAYELGWKQSFGEHHQHHFNFGAFYYDYKDLQVSVLLDTTKGGQTFNAGKATIYGLEASADFKLDADTGFHASVNYLHSRYDELLAQYNVFTVPSTAANGNLNGIGDLDPVKPGIQQPNFAGNTPPFSPQFIITVGLDHVFKLGDAGTLTARVDTTFKTRYYTDFYNYRDGTQDAYSQTDVSVEYKPLNKRFSVQAFARNLENERPLTYGSFVAAGPTDAYNWQFGAPRTYGVRVGVNF